MTLTTFNNRTSRLQKNSKGYQMVLELMESHYVRPCHTSGSKRFCTNLDYTSDVLFALDLLKFVKGVDYISGNDAPRGGLTGNFIELTAKGKRRAF